MTMTPQIRRGFADLDHGQLHYRSAGAGPPAMVLHMSPGSSRQHVGLIAGLAGRFHVIAPDTPGNGDSPALPLAAPQITDLAQAMLAFMDAQDLHGVTLYGSHTGAAIAAEIAILAPSRVARLILDGVQLIDADERTELLDRYAHPFPPDLDGAWLARVFQFCRDQFVFYPWYDRTAAARRGGGLPPADTLAAMVVEVLKASETYHLNYAAAFRWDPLARLPLLRVPALMVAAADDPLADNTRTLAPYLPGAQFMALPAFASPDYAAALMALFQPA